MKILTLLGSPHKRGNTSKILNLFDKSVHELGHSVSRMDVASEKLNGCLGCGTCKKPGKEFKCVQEDTANSIFSQMIDSDKIVYAAPLYCWDFPAQMKALIDRHFCLVTNYGEKNHKSVLEGKSASLMVTCAGPIENNADLIGVVFERVCAFTKMKLTTIDIFPNAQSPIVIDDKIESTIKRSAHIKVQD